MAFVETRRWRRGAPAATARISTAGGHPVGHYKVDNLSAGGALLVGAPPVPVGSYVSIELRLPARLPVKVAAVVVRHEEDTDGGAAFAVLFHRVPSDVEDMIQQAGVEALEKERRERIPVLLSLGEPAGGRYAVERAAAEMGRQLVCVPTPLDALRCLEDPHAHIEAALVGLEFGRSPASEILRFLADHFPEVRRIFLVDADTGAVVLQEVRAARIADAILLAPWNRAQLEEAVGHPRPSTDAPM